MWSALQNLWPFSAFTYDDLRASDSIVKKLPIPESTRHFVYAIREPESGAVIYVLSAQNLSERSALDAEYLIREVNDLLCNGGLCWDENLVKILFHDRDATEILNIRGLNPSDLSGF
ncbi:tryptophan synthase alpha chain [Striga asiatica]|uniref:Tryptophan synthase alpha chain n=1 Tax=Striga asiatica TaxID=4170 RepID=A0A5A7QK74_STRAF|nr:tryptophan synthase alpha chain [Striga asiatica]